MKPLTVVQKQRFISKNMTQAWLMLHYDSLYLILYYSFDFIFPQFKGMVDHFHCRQGKPKETDDRNE